MGIGYPCGIDPMDEMSGCSVVGREGSTPVPVT